MDTPKLPYVRIGFHSVNPKTGYKLFGCYLQLGPFRYWYRPTLGMKSCKPAQERMNSIIQSGEVVPAVNNADLYEKVDCTCPQCVAKHPEGEVDENCPRCKGKGWTDLGDEARFKAYVRHQETERALAAFVTQEQLELFTKPQQ